MHVRVKRGTKTFFILVHPSETIMELKQKIQSATEIDFPPAGLHIERQRLTSGPNMARVLEDRYQLSQLKVDNDQVLALTIRADGEDESAYEDVVICEIGTPEAEAWIAKEEEARAKEREETAARDAAEAAERAAQMKLDDVVTREKEGGGGGGGGGEGADGDGDVVAEGEEEAAAKKEELKGVEDGD
jgi:hypothetical protein